MIWTVTFFSLSRSLSIYSAGITRELGSAIFLGQVSRKGLSLSTREQHCRAVACRAAKRPAVQPWNAISSLQRTVAFPLPSPPPPPLFLDENLTKKYLSVFYWVPVYVIHGENHGKNKLKKISKYQALNLVCWIIRSLLISLNSDKCVIT